MIVFAKSNTLILTSYWIFSFSQFHLVSEAIRPQCKGTPLDPEKFSAQEDVGFVRDVCIDIIARNVYNTFEISVSDSCKQLANTRTSTCFFICFKWKRSSIWYRIATNEVMNKARELMETLLNDISKIAPVDQIAGKFVFEIIDDAKHRLINSGAVSENSQIVDYLEDLKTFLCRHCAILDNKDLIEVINQFINNLEAKNGVTVSNYSIEDNVVEKITMAGIVRLRFDYKKGGDTKAGAAIVKIPSLAPFYNTKRKNKDMYPREAYFYAKLLPAMYQMGKCEPFAPKLYAITKANALILEDLSFEGYQSELNSEFLDLDHSRILLSVLAQYHALGYVYFRNVNKDESTMRLIGSHQPQINTETSKDHFDAFCKVVKPLLNQNLYKKIRMAKDKILATLPTKNEDEENSMIVIIHGDLHRKNFLFKYDLNGKVYKAKIIDWQFSREASPIIDLIEFFVDHINAEIFVANENHLLELYLAVFNYNLSLLRTNRRYNRPELDRDMVFYKYHYYRVLSNIGEWISESPEEDMELSAANIAKWLIYLDRKGFI